MNRKIQDSDSLFIVARYKRDPHGFSARGEAVKYKVSLRTIYNVLAQAGVKMRRGRKPLLPPQPLISTSDAPQTLISAPVPAPEPLNPLDMLNLVDHLDHPKPPVTPKKPKRGPPVIRPKAR